MRNLSISGWAFVGLALLILLLPFKWVAAAVLAATVHEGGHLLALRLCGCRTDRLVFGLSGAVIESESLPPWKELICVLAGPAAGLMLLFLVRWFPRLALCGAIHSLYNLLPIYPMDGGRAIRCVSVLLLCPEQANTCCEILEMMCRVGLLFTAFYAAFILHLGFFPLIIVTLILIKTKIGKSPCKHGAKAVQ